MIRRTSAHRHTLSTILFLLFLCHILFPSVHITPLEVSFFFRPGYCIEGLFLEAWARRYLNFEIGGQSIYRPFLRIPPFLL